MKLKILISDIKGVPTAVPRFLILGGENSKQGDDKIHRQVGQHVVVRLAAPHRRQGLRVHHYQAAHLGLILSAGPVRPQFILRIV